MSDDEQVALLREIRDILNGQTELVRTQWAESARLCRKNMIASIIAFFPLAVLVAYLIAKDF